MTACVPRDVGHHGELSQLASGAGRAVVAVIGIDHYQRWPRLGNAVRDAAAVALVFRDLGFDEAARPLLNEDATNTAMWSLVTHELTALGSEDRLVIFYAGHGATKRHSLGEDVIKTGYLIPVDAQEETHTWIELESWLRAVALLPARHILVILDACHSGVALAPLVKWRDVSSGREDDLGALTSRRSRRVIASALDDQIALDNGPIDGHSLFTGCLIEGLRNDLLPMTTGSGLGVYLQGRVATYPGSQQTPDFGAFVLDDRGEIVINLSGSQNNLSVERSFSKTPVSLSQVNQFRVMARLPRELRRFLNGILQIARSFRRKLFLVLFGLGTIVVVAAVIVKQTGRQRKSIATLTSMIRFDGGYFAMGRTKTELEDECRRLGKACRKDALDREQPSHRVFLSPFFLDIHETTNQEFASWLNVDASRFTITDDSVKRPRSHVNDATGVLLLDLYPVYLGIGFDEGPRRRFFVHSGYENKPVVQVTWDAAFQFCAARGKRLPTEAEWEFAARGNTPRRYPWGDEEPRCDGTVLARDKGAVCAGFSLGPSAVTDSWQDWTAEHVADMGGNVMEWVSDAFVLPYYPPCGECLNPRQENPSPGVEDNRVVRGGSWGTFIFARTSARGRWRRQAVADSLGFRCAVDAQ